MPTTPTYPGVYIEEIPSGVRTITGVATSITAFVGRAKKGEPDDPILIHSFADYERKFGGLWEESTMSYAVQHYFMHGGRDALIVRVINDGEKASVTLPTTEPTGEPTPEPNPETTPGIVLEAASEGTWGDNIRVSVNYETKEADPDTGELFNLVVRELRPPSSTDIVAEEIFRNLSVDPKDARYIESVLEQQSQLVRVENIPAEPVGRPEKTLDENDDVVFVPLENGGDGDGIDAEQLTTGTDYQKNHMGVYALDKADLFNILCIPPLSRTTDVGFGTTLADAVSYCKEKRAMLIVDPPSGWSNPESAKSGLDALRSALGTDYCTNAAAYFPGLKMPDPLKENLVEEFAPCGAVAGIYARTDAKRGVWKAPAGQEASFSGVREFTCKLTDRENGDLNQLGLNCLRSFPVYGNIVWGARTLAGADRLASEWKYIPVRRLALYIEESLYRGTQWVVFEPNDEPLWAQIRLNVGAFMHDLFVKGAFQGTAPRDAYFVKCDSETTTQNDIDKGIVNILVGFAPLKPAEFVIIKIQQIAGDIQT
ncbi:MAG: phage tail sheath C-terminal domain-containing protein [Actinomycetota bacterium]|nr:phage tail sheath C-terminal domain-containing protein [Actinomycetota bacterium]